MALITGRYANLTRSVKLIPWPGEHEVLFAASSDRLPSHPTKGGRAADSRFALIRCYKSPTLGNVYKSPSAYSICMYYNTVVYLFLYCVSYRSQTALQPTPPRFLSATPMYVSGYKQTTCRSRAWLRRHFSLSASSRFSFPLP